MNPSGGGAKGHAIRAGHRLITITPSGAERPRSLQGSGIRRPQEWLHPYLAPLLTMVKAPGQQESLHAWTRKGSHRTQTMAAPVVSRFSIS